MTRTDKVKAYNVLGLNQRRREMKIGSPRWVQCGSEMIQAMNKLTPGQLNFVNSAMANRTTDWVSELSKL